MKSLLSSLDVLGACKWPSLLAITVAPLLGYALSWRHVDAGLGAAVYGPESLAGVPVVLARPSGQQPQKNDVNWFVRTCAGCTADLQAVRIAYGACEQPPTTWVEAYGVSGLLSARLTRATAGPPCIWVELQRKGDAVRRHRWQLGTTS